MGCIWYAYGVCDMGLDLEVVVVVTEDEWWWRTDRLGLVMRIWKFLISCILVFVFNMTCDLYSTSMVNLSVACKYSKWMVIFVEFNDEPKLEIFFNIFKWKIRWRNIEIGTAHKSVLERGILKEIHYCYNLELINIMNLL